MTEAEWLVCTDPYSMLSFLRGKVSERRLRLLACACCRRLLPLSLDERAAHAVGVALRLADGTASPAEVQAAGVAVNLAFHQATNADSHLMVAAESTLAEDAFEAAYFAMENADYFAFEAFGTSPWLESIGLFRDIVGNPFVQPALNPRLFTWNDGALAKMAQAIYDEETFDRVAILADALEDAGCTDGTVLSHCRGPGEHVRGCWVLDLLLAKE